MRLPSILGIRGARDKPKDSYGGSAYSFFFGRSASGKNVNERAAMQTTAVYSCVRILAETVASLPVHLYRYTETGKERVYDHSLYRMLNDEPNPEMTSFVFRETLSHLLIWGMPMHRLSGTGTAGGLLCIRSCQIRWRLTVMRTGSFIISILGTVTRTRILRSMAGCTCGSRMYCISPALGLTGW